MPGARPRKGAQRPAGASPRSGRRSSHQGDHHRLSRRAGSTKSQGQGKKRCPRASLTDCPRDSPGEPWQRYQCPAPCPNRWNLSLMVGPGLPEVLITPHLPPVVLRCCQGREALKHTSLFKMDTRKDDRGQGPREMHQLRSAPPHQSVVWQVASNSPLPPPQRATLAHVPGQPRARREGFGLFSPRTLTSKVEKTKRFR